MFLVGSYTSTSTAVASEINDTTTIKVLVVSSESNVDVNGKGFYGNKVNPTNLKDIPLTEVLKYNSIALNKADISNADFPVVWNGMSK
jgi:hypothetical protein